MVVVVVVVVDVLGPEVTTGTPPVVVVVVVVEVLVEVPVLTGTILSVVPLVWVTTTPDPWVLMVSPELVMMTWVLLVV